MHLNAGQPSGAACFVVIIKDQRHQGATDIPKVERPLVDVAAVLRFDQRSWASLTVFGHVRADLSAISCPNGRFGPDFGLINTGWKKPP